MIVPANVSEPTEPFSYVRFQLSRWRFVAPAFVGATPFTLVSFIEVEAMKRVKNGRLYLIPASGQTSGHLTTGNARFYKQQLQEFLQLCRGKRCSGRIPPPGRKAAHGNDSPERRAGTSGKAGIKRRAASGGLAGTGWMAMTG
jgi:hypothetical protein